VNNDQRNRLRSLLEYSQELSIVTIRYSMCMVQPIRIRLLMGFFGNAVHEYDVE